MKAQKRYVISTTIFTSLDDAEEQIRVWRDQEDLRPGTKVFEISGEIYEPKLNLIKVKGGEK